MKKILLLGMLLLLFCPNINAEKKWFDKDKLTITGVYYYPEHWNESEWERDLKKIHDSGFEFIHMAEFSWAMLEPQEGVYDFTWLDKVIALADKYQLKVILGTPTAAPPVWLVRKYPEVLLEQENGIKLDHGARQHASFTSDTYRRLSGKIVTEMGRHYGHDPRIMGWQLDNEPAVQFDYSDEAQKKFRQFLKKKYKNEIKLLNEAWGTAFWSQVYSSFDDITLPQTSQVFMNPHQILDYRRFAAEQTNTFLNDQCLILKKYIRNQWVTTNYIPNYEDGHIGGSPDLDFPSYTRYMVYGDNEGIGRRGYRVGNPLRIAWANDFFRPFQDSYGVMELQPGQVNWGGINPQPMPGAVRLWLWSVFAGGSDFICTYRYRQPLSGMEQYHYGIVGTDGQTLTPGGKEFITFMNEIKSLRKVKNKAKHLPNDYLSRKTAILFNPENSWNINRQKQTWAWNTLWHIEKYYRALKSFGAPVDFITESKRFEDYPVMIVPAYQLADSGLVTRCTDYVRNGGHLILTCRTAQKDRCGRFPAQPFGSMLDRLSGTSIKFFDTLLPNNPGTINMNNRTYQWKSWGEILSPHDNTTVLATYTNEFYDGQAAVTTRRLGKGSVTYIGADSQSGDLEYDILKKIFNDLNIPVMNLPYGVTMEFRNGFGIVMNYSDKPYDFSLPEGARPIIGEKNIPPVNVLVFKY